MATQEEFDFEQRSASSADVPTGVVDKIKKLLRLAADKSNRHEAEQALRRAFEMARKHRIDVSTIDLDEKTEHILHEDRDFPRRVSFLQFRAINLVIRFFNVNGILGSGRITFIGKPSEIALAHYAYEFIVHVGNRELRGYEASEKKARRRMSTGKRQSFIQGYIYGIALQLRNAEAEMPLDDSQTALVVAEAAERDAYSKQQFPSTKDVSRDIKRKVRSSMEQGYDAGRRTNIRTPLSGPSAPLILAIE
jgi:ribosomal protein L16/L10AE